MNSKAIKLCAIAIVAAFIVTAFVVIPADESSADDTSKTYYIHFEEVNSTYETVKSIWIEFKAADATWGEFQKAANLAFKNYNIDEEFSDAGWLTGYGGDCSTWFVKDGNWTAVNDGKTEYIAGDVIGVAAGPGSYTYGSAPPAEVASRYYKASDTYYQRLPCVGVDDYKANNHKTYYVHFDFVPLASDLKPTNSTWLRFDATDDTMEAFVAGVNSQMALYKIDLSFGMNGWITSATYSGSSTWTVVDGEWKAVTTTATDYKAATVIGLVMGPGSYTYGSAPPAETIDLYYKASDTYYQRYPSVTVSDYKDAVKTYNIVYEAIGDDCKVTKTVKFNFEATDKDNTALMAGINKAFAKEGVLITASIGSYFKFVSADASKITTWFTTDGGEWKHTTETMKQYISADAIALEVGAKSVFMNAEPPADVKDNYMKDPDYETYYRIPDTGADFYKGSNMLLYIAIGAVAVVAVIILAFVFIKKK